MTKQKIENAAFKQYTVKEIHSWLFNQGSKPDAQFPPSKLYNRDTESVKPKVDSSSLSPIGEGSFSGRVHIHSGSITDIRMEDGVRGAVATSNNGDLLTGCGYAVAKAVINAAGAGLQAEVYNSYGVPGVMQQPQYGRDNYPETEGRGYAISCQSYDMKQSHNIDRIEMLTVPYENNPDNDAGVVNMYYEAFEHNKDLDYMLVPMAGVSHPLLMINGFGPANHDKSAELTMQAYEKFIRNNPQSRLKLVCVIFNDKAAEASYEKHAKAKDAQLQHQVVELPLSKQEEKQEVVEDDIAFLSDKGWYHYGQQWLEQTYLQPFHGQTKKNPREGNIERTIHGAMHASRVALSSMMLHRLCQAHYGETAEKPFQSLMQYLNMTEEQTLCLIRYVALGHDAKRQGESVDIWENESAEEIQQFLHQHGINPEIALIFSNLASLKDKPDQLAQFLGKSGLSEEAICGLQYARMLVSLSDCFDVMRDYPTFAFSYIENKLFEVLGYDEGRDGEIFFEYAIQLAELIIKQKDNNFQRFTLVFGEQRQTYTNLERLDTDTKKPLEHAENAITAMEDSLREHAYFQSLLSSQGEGYLSSPEVEHKSSSELLQMTIDDEPKDYKKENMQNTDKGEAYLSSPEVEHTSSNEQTLQIIIDDEPEDYKKENMQNTDISMLVVSGFVATLGIAAVVVAFVLLNAASFGVAGLITAGVGATFTLGGIGMFAAAKNNNNSTGDHSDLSSECTV